MWRRCAKRPREPAPCGARHRTRRRTGQRRRGTRHRAAPPLPVLSLPPGSVRPRSPARPDAGWRGRRGSTTKTPMVAPPARGRAPPPTLSRRGRWSGPTLRGRSPGNRVAERGSRFCPRLSSTIAARSGGARSAGHLPGRHHPTRRPPVPRCRPCPVASPPTSASSRRARTAAARRCYPCSRAPPWAAPPTTLPSTRSHSVAVGWARRRAWTRTQRSWPPPEERGG